MTVDELLIKFGIDSSGAHKGASEVQSDLKKIEGQSGSSMGAMSGHLDEGTKHVGIMGKATGGLGSAFSVMSGMLMAQAIPALIDAGKHAMELVTAEDAINAQTGAVLKSTGGASHMTAASVDELASALSRQDGVSVEVVKSNENMLLTFTSIRNEVGKGNDVFDQATQTVQNMSQALGEDGKSAAIQLGKALNDPIAGMTALKRVGVAFTESQKEQITTLQKSGDLLGAQKIILGELNTEFGGSAEAFGDSSAGAMAKIGNSVDEAEKGFARLVLPMAEAGLKLLPPLIDGAASLAGTVGNLVGQFMGLQPVKDMLSIISNAVFDISGAVGALFSSGDIGAFSSDLGGIFAGIANGIMDAAPGILNAALSLWMQLEEAIWDVAPKVIDAIASAAQGAFDWIINTGVPKMANAVGPMFDKFTAWLPVIVPKIGRALSELVGKIGEFIITNAPVLVGKLGEWGQALVGWIGARLPSLLASLGDMLGKIGAWIVNTGVPTLTANLIAMGEALVAWIGPNLPKILKSLGDMLVSIGSWLLNTGIPTFVGKMGDFGRAGVAALMDFFVGSKGQAGLLQKLNDWFLNTFVPALPGIALSMVSSLVGFAGDIGRSIIKGLGDALVGIGSALFNAIKAGLEWALDQGIQVGPVKLGIGHATISTPLGNFSIPGLATGVSNFDGGLAIVGEKGPELAYLPKGTDVIPNDQIGSAAGGTKTVNNYVTINNPIPEKSPDSTRRVLSSLVATGHM
jgi:hypothetical protein